jgi:predicted dehydrogenase
VKSPLKGVIVGAGYFSRFQYEAWNRIPEVIILANCNRSLEKAESFAQEFGISKSYASAQFREMLEIEKPDFVDIITPPETHLEFCKIAAELGVTIICQKPLAPTWDETLKLVELIESSDVRCMVHENWRGQPWYREIKSLIEAIRLATSSTATFTRVWAMAGATMPTSPVSPFFGTTSVSLSSRPAFTFSIHSVFSLERSRASLLTPHAGIP